MKEKKNALSLPLNLTLSLYFSIRCKKSVSRYPRFCFAFSRFSTASNRQSITLLLLDSIFPIPLMSIITRGASTAHALTDVLLFSRSIRTLYPQKHLSSSSFLALTKFTVEFFNLIYSRQLFLSNPPSKYFW